MLNQSDLEQLVTRLESFMLLSTSFKLALKTGLESKQFKSGTILTKYGDIPNYVWFILDGIAEESWIDTESRQHSPNWFWTRNDFVFTSPGFFSQQPSSGTILIRRDARLIPIPQSEFIQSHQQYRETQKLTEFIRSYYASLFQQRLYDLTHLNNEQRYQKFKKNFKEILYTCSQNQIAAFLGMSYRTFYRLHNK